MPVVTPPFTNAAFIPITTGAAPTVLPLGSPNIPVWVYIINTGGTGGQEIAQLPPLPSDVDGYNWPHLNYTAVIVLDSIQTIETLLIQNEFGATNFFCLNELGVITGVVLNGVLINFQSGAAAFVWNGTNWIFSNELNDNSTAFDAYASTGYVLSNPPAGIFKVTDNGTLCTNNGDGVGAEVIYLLPPAVQIDGRPQMTFDMSMTTFNGVGAKLTFQAAGADTIRNIGTVSVAGGKISTVTQGGGCGLTCGITGEWYVDHSRGALIIV